MYRLTESYPSQHALGGVKGVVGRIKMWLFCHQIRPTAKEGSIFFAKKHISFPPPPIFFLLLYNLWCVYGPPHALFCLYFPLICFSFVFLLPFFFNISLSPVNCFSNGRESCYYLLIVIRQTWIKTDSASFFRIRIRIIRSSQKLILIWSMNVDNLDLFYEIC